MQGFESDEQQALMQWAALEAGRWPELRLLYHIPNGGRRGKSEAARMRREGVRAGVPDLCLPVARGKWHGLYIELKRREGGRASEAQKAWLEALEEQGYCAKICRGWEEAANEIAEYLRRGIG